MRFFILKGIYKKELRDVLRDRRALISMLIVPLVVFPLLIGGMTRLIPLIAQRAEAEAGTLAIASKISSPAIREGLEKAGLHLVDKDDLKAAVQSKSVGAAVEESAGAEGPGSPPRIQIYVDASNPASSATGERLREALTELKDREIRDSLRSSGIGESVLTPFTVSRTVNVAGERKMAGALYGTMLGYILVLLMFTGGMYTVLDMTAGEKERKTLEALLASPARRGEIVMGKILAAITATLATAALTLASLTYTLKNSSPAFGNQPPSAPGMGANDPRAENLRALTGVIPLDASTLGLIAVIFIPLAIFAASLMFAIALKARSFKEGQTYLTPLVFLAIFPALLGGLPGLKMTPALCLIPIFNASQMIHGILIGDASAVNLAVTLAANLVYSAIAFKLATRMFEDERVLFRT
jgi:sodium transport system permease protein